MDNGKAEAADTAGNDVSAAVKESSDAQSEVVESAEDEVGDQVLATETGSGPLSRSSESELTISTDEGEEHAQPDGAGQNQADSTRLDPEPTIDDPPAVGSVEDLECSGMEIGSSVAEDVISSEEADSSGSKGSEETRGIDIGDSENIHVTGNLNDAFGDVGVGDLAQEGVDSAETAASISGSVVDAENKEESENSAKGGENSQTESDGAAKVEEGQKSLTDVEADVAASSAQESTVPEGTVEELRDDKLPDNGAEVIRDVPTTINATTDFVEEVQEPESDSEPWVSEAPEPERSKDVGSDVSGEGQGVVESKETSTNEGVHDSPLVAAAAPDNGTLEAESVESSAIPANAITSEIDATDSSGSSLTVPVEDDVSATGEDQGSANGSSPQIDPTSLSSREDNEHETHEEAENVPAEGEKERSVDIGRNELVWDGETEKSAEVGEVNKDDLGARTDGAFDPPRPIVMDGTNTSSSNSVEVAEISEASDGPVEDVDKSIQLPVDAKEIAANEQDASTSDVETAEELVVGADGETESESPTVRDAPQSSALASAHAPGASSIADAIEQVENTNASPDTDDVGEVHTEPEKRFSSKEEVGDEQVVQLEKVEVPLASDATDAVPPNSADILEAVEEDEATEGPELAGLSISPRLDTEENVEVTSKEQNVPISRLEEVDEEQAVGAHSEVEIPGGVDPDTTDMKALSADEVSEIINTGVATDILENKGALQVASDTDKHVEGVAEEHDTPTSATDIEAEKNADTVNEFEPLGQTDGVSKSIERDSFAAGLTEGGVTELSEEVDISSETSPDVTEIEGNTERDAPASVSESVEEEQIAVTDPGTSNETDVNAVETSLLTSVQSPESSRVSETGDGTELLTNADVSREFTRDADMGSEVGNEQDNSGDSDTVDAEEVTKTEGDVDSPCTIGPDAAGVGLLTSAKIHPEVIETEDVPNHEEKADSSYLTSDERYSKEAVDTQGALCSSEEVKDGDTALSSISPGTAERVMGQDEQVTDLVQIVETPSLQDLSTVEPTVASVTSEEPEEEKVLPCESADVGDAKVSEHEISVGDTPQFSSGLNSLKETDLPEKQQERGLPLEGPAATVIDNQISGEQPSETFSKVDESFEVIDNEDLVGESESSVPVELSDISFDDKTEHVLVAEMPVSTTSDVSITTSSVSEGDDSAEAEKGELPRSGPVGENTALPSASGKTSLVPSLSADPAVSTFDESVQEQEIGESESEPKGLVDSASDAPKDSESLEDIILEVARSALEQGAVQELIPNVTENVCSLPADEDTSTEVKVPERNEISRDHENTPFEASATEEKVIFTTSFKKLSPNTEDQEDSADKGDLLHYSSPHSSSISEESLEAKESTGKLVNDRRTDAVLHSSGPSSHPVTIISDGDVEQKETSGNDNVFVKNIVTSDRPVEAVKTISFTTPIASHYPLGSSDVNFQSLPAVKSPDIQQTEILSVNQANLAAAMKVEFLMEEENHPLTEEHLFEAKKGHTPASSGSDEDSSTRGASAADISPISQGETSTNANSPLQLGSPNVRKDDASVPLSTNSGDLSSSWVVVPPLAGASEFRHRSSVSEENIEKQIPRLRGVAHGGEGRRSVPDRDVPAAITPVKATDSVPKSRAEVIRRDEDSNDAKFPLSVMLWCSKSLSSLFGSTKSL